jgi:hypothetical protein
MAWSISLADTRRTFVVGEDAKVERRVIFYHPDTGQIVSSWTFARAADATGGERLAMEAAVKQHLKELRAAHGVEIATMDDDRTAKLTQLTHRVDVRSKKLVLSPRRDLPFKV